MRELVLNRLLDMWWLNRSKTHAEFKAEIELLSDADLLERFLQFLEAREEHYAVRTPDIYGRDFS